MKGEFYKLKNEIHSTIKQILIDLLAECPDLIQQIDEIDKKLTNDICKKVDDRFYRHQYPLKKITYNRTSNIETCPELQSLFRLSVNAYAIFKNLIDINESNNNLVRIPMRSKSKNKVICTLQDMTNLDIKSIRKAIKILVDYDFLRVFQQPVGNKATVYMINPKYSLTGKEQILKWNELEKGSMVFDDIADYRAQMTTYIEQDAKYDDSGNETLYDTHFKITEMVIPNGDATATEILINSMTDMSQKEPKL